MTEEERNNYFVKELDTSQNIDPEKWCEKCKYSHAFLMDGIGLCRKQNNRLCYYCSTCRHFKQR